jgi:hypothetical protein
MPAPAPLLEGWLHRRAILGFWLRRFARLCANTLSIFKDESCSAIQSSFEITSDTCVEVLDKETRPRFKITAPCGDTLLLQCESDDERLRWVLAIRGCAFANPALSMHNFDIISVVGRGFYGKVMLCENTETHERVAIKSIHKSALLQPNKVHTVLSERGILSRVNNPFIVSLKFAFQTAAKFYLGLEYAPGGELFPCIHTHGMLALEDVRLYLAEICLALDYLHSQGIVYRDLKRENVLLDADGHVKLTDFSLAKTFCVRY